MMKKFYSLLAAALVSTMGFAQLRSVTFQVDMMTATISADGIHAAGDWQDTAGYGGNWNPDTTLFAQVGTSNIYSVTVNIPDGKWRFKFINGKGWGNVEGVPADNQVGGGDDNRFVHVTKDTTLAAVQFAGWSPTGKKLVRFQVDVAQQTGVTSVSAAGDWQMAAGYPADWNSTDCELFVTNPNTPTIYENIYYVVADTFAYKFITNGTGWETVPSGCEVGGNRQIIVGNNPNVPGTVCYGMCVACPTAPIPQYSLTLMVDMQNHLACNLMDSLDVAGSLNGWGGGDLLTDMGNNIWAVTLMVDSGEVQFKFRSFESGNTGWEGVPNRLITLSANDTAKACFNVDGLNGYCTPIAPKEDLTFEVDMATWGGSIDTAGVFLMGDFTNWESGAMKMTSMGAGIYEITITDFCPGQLFFKFVNGTPDPSDPSNQENAGLDSTCAKPNGLGGWNRFYERPAAGSAKLSYIFDSCTGANIGIGEDFTNEVILISPNPISDFAVVNLSTEGMFNINVMDMTGRIVKTINNVNGAVILERGNLNAGVYIMMVSDERGNLNSTKFIIE